MRALALILLTAAPPPPADLPSPRPSEGDWAHAPAIALARAHPRCEARRLREWVRITCRLYVTEVALAGGSAEGVHLSHGPSYVEPPSDPWSYATKIDDAYIVFPTRPGDRRLFQLLDSDFVRWGGVDLDAVLAISEVWLPGEAGPTIAIH